MGTKRLLAVSWLQRILAPAFALYLRFVWRTSSVELYHPHIPRDFFDRKEALIACFWHGRLAPMLLFWPSVKKEHVAEAWPLAHRFRALVAPRNEGLLFNGMIRRLGIETILGTGGLRSISAARQICESLRHGESIFFAADAPRGPVFEASRELIRLAQSTGAPLLPIGCASTRRCFFNTWDRFLLPLPFGKLVYVFGSPLYAERNLDLKSFEETRWELSARLNAAMENADRIARNRQGDDYSVRG